MEPQRHEIIDDMKHFLKPYLKREPTSEVVRVGINDIINKSSHGILIKLLLLKHFIETELPQSKAIFSNLVDRSDNYIARFRILTHF